MSNWLIDYHTYYVNYILCTYLKQGRAFYRTTLYIDSPPLTLYLFEQKEARKRKTNENTI